MLPAGMAAVLLAGGAVAVVVAAAAAAESRPERAKHSRGRPGGKSQPPPSGPDPTTNIVRYDGPVRLCTLPGFGGDPRDVFVPGILGTSIGATYKSGGRKGSVWGTFTFSDASQDPNQGTHGLFWRVVYYLDAGGYRRYYGQVYNEEGAVVWRSMDFDEVNGSCEDPGAGYAAYWAQRQAAGFDVWGLAAYNPMEKFRR